MITTEHAALRGKERMGLNKKALKRVANKALEKGVKHSETKGSLNRFLNGLYLQYKKANNMRVYNREVFLFYNDMLITIIDLPQKFHKTVDRIKKKRLN